MRRTLITLFGMLTFISISFLQSNVYAAGGTMSCSGTAMDPFQVADYADLKMVGTTTTYSLSAVYRLVADIDASPSAIEHGDSGFVPIGTPSSSFTGIFHGSGHVIKSLKINRKMMYVGLFGYSGGNIDSVGLVGGSIYGNYYTGGLLGYNYKGNVNSCYTTNSVSGDLAPNYWTVN